MLRPSDQICIEFEDQKDFDRYPYDFRLDARIAPFAFAFDYDTLLRHLIGAKLSIAPDRVGRIRLDYDGNEASSIQKTAIIPKDTSDILGCLTKYNINLVAVCECKKQENGDILVVYELPNFHFEPLREKNAFFAKVLADLHAKASLPKKPSISYNPVREENGDACILQTAVPHTLKEWLDYIQASDARCEIQICKGSFKKPTHNTWIGRDIMEGNWTKDNYLNNHGAHNVYQIRKLDVSPLHDDPAYELWIDSKY